MLMFLDLESSGLIKRNLPPDSPEQPWCCSIAAMLTNMDGKELASINTPIRANGRSIEKGAAAVHGVSSQQAGRTGIDEVYALAPIFGRKGSFATQALYLIGHNISFDVGVIESVMLRAGLDVSALKRPGLTQLCTMKSATPFCKIVPDPPRTDGSFKWPGLDQACAILLDEPPREGHHTAFEDMQKAMRLFFLLRERGAFELEGAA